MRKEEIGSQRHGYPNVFLTIISPELLARARDMAGEITNVPVDIWWTFASIPVDKKANPSHPEIKLKKMWNVTD